MNNLTVAIVWREGSYLQARGLLGEGLAGL